MEFELIHTERLVLRMLTPEVYHYIMTSYTDQELMVFLGIHSPEQLTAEKQKYKQGLSTYNRTFVNFQLIDNQSNCIIGGCGFHTWYPMHSRAEIGYALYEDIHKAKGYMTEAMTAIIKYGFESMQLNRIEALIGPDNLPSNKLVQKLGFIQEGYLHQHYCKEGVIQDSIMYALLKEAYKLV